MKTKIENMAASWLSVIALMLNYFPYAIFILLIDYHGNQILNVLPLAVFFAFRRTALFIFRDFRKNETFLGWIGLLSGLIGYTIGIFGIFNRIFFVIAAVFIGSAAAIFPTSLNQTKRNNQEATAKRGNSTNRIGMILGILAVILIYAYLVKFYPSWAFVFMLFWNVVAIIGYHALYGKMTVPKNVEINWGNLALLSIFLIALFMMEWGRSHDRGSIVAKAIILLALFLVILLLILISDRRKHLTKASKKLYLQMMLYGVCGMFWVSYSTIFITILYGVDLFAWVFVAYIAGMLLEKPVVKLVMKVSPFSALTTNTIFMILGILGTFWLPTYYVGIFVIRVFANAQKRIAIDDYEKETGNYQEVHYLSYYLTTLSAFLTQTIMWSTLIICCSIKGLNKLLHAMTFHQIAANYSGSINLTHVVLAAFMIVFTLFTYVVSKRDEAKKNVE